MTDEKEARAKVQGALGPAAPDPGLRSRVMASMPIEPAGSSRWQWAAGAVAVVLALTMVTGLLLVRHRSSAQPAASGHLAGTLVMTTRLDFRCALPVQGYLSDALISFPDGGVTVERVQQQAKGSAMFGSVYVAGRWLPVPLAWVSADGRSYAYITSTTGVPGQPQTTALYVHDIARGGDRQLWSGTGYAQMIGWGPGGVFFTHQPVGAGVTGPVKGMEVWVVDPANPGAAHRVGPNPAQPASPGEAAIPLFQVGTRIAGDSAWTVRISRVQGPVPPPGGAQGSPSQVVRMDLKDGSLSTWFTAPEGTAVSIAGTDQQAHPILVITTIPAKAIAGPANSGAPPTPPATPMYPPPPRVVLLSGPDQTTEISSGSDPAFRPTTAMADSHGIWFASPGSLWLYRQGSLAKVADVPESLFPPPSPPPNAPTPPSYVKPSLPPGYPQGVSLALDGPCR